MHVEAAFAVRLTHHAPQDLSDPSPGNAVCNVDAFSAAGQHSPRALIARVESTPPMTGIIMSISTTSYLQQRMNQNNLIHNIWCKQG
jgi:hypothetical protein